MTLASLGPAAERPRVLCVDDEPHVLEGLKDTLRRTFDIRVATSGAAGLAQLHAAPDAFSVVVSDMRMPLMDGAVFLREARRVAPDAARILLTGQADVGDAAAAVNEGQLFRFLTKPCRTDELVRACAEGAERRRLKVAERSVLEQTLHGSVEALADVLALASPSAFGRSTRVKAVVSRLAERIGVEDRWEVEVAALMAPLGAITLPDTVTEKLYTGAPLTASEEAMVDAVPATTRAILAHIPRLEGVHAILDATGRRFDSATPERPVPVGARLLRLVLDHDVLERQGAPADVAMAALRGRTGLYDPALLDAFGELLAQPADVTVREIPLARLVAGMTLLDDVRATSGTLLIAHGQLASAELVTRLANLPRGYVREPLRVGAGVSG